MSKYVEGRELLKHAGDFVTVRCVYRGKQEGNTWEARALDNSLLTVISTTCPERGQFLEVAGWVTPVGMLYEISRKNTHISLNG
jgi:hypothetical protein